MDLVDDVTEGWPVTEIPSALSQMFHGGLAVYIILVAMVAVRMTLM